MGIQVMNCGWLIGKDLGIMTTHSKEIYQTTKSNKVIFDGSNDLPDPPRVLKLTISFAEVDL